MDNAAPSEITTDVINKWADHIGGKLALFSRRGGDKDTYRNNLLKLSPSTLKWTMAAVVNSASIQLMQTIQILLPMGAEKSLLCHVRYWETYEYKVPTSVHRPAVFQYLDDAPLLGSPDEMLPYVAKAHALIAVANAFGMVVSSASSVGEVERVHSEYVELFVSNKERALELANLMMSGKTSMDDLKYHLELHAAISEGEL